jgi:uridine kinase
MDKISLVVKDIEDLAAKKDNIFVAIDGNGGAGKSTLSRHLEKAIPSLKVIGMDYYYDPELKRSDYIRVKEELLVPLKNNQRATSKIYDWPNERFSESVWTEPQGIILFEGWYSMEENLVDLYDYRIWVDCPAEKGMERGLTRDNGKYKDHWENIWVPEMKRYGDSQKPYEKANIVINYLDIPVFE